MCETSSFSNKIVRVPSSGEHGNAHIFLKLYHLRLSNFLSLLIKVQSLGPYTAVLVKNNLTVKTRLYKKMYKNNKKFLCPLINKACFLLFYFYLFTFPTYKNHINIE